MRILRLPSVKRRIEKQPRQGGAAMLLTEPYQAKSTDCNQVGISRAYRDRGSKQTRFEALVQALSTDLYRYAFWLCRDQSQAEELVQETFLRAWRSLDSLRCEKAAKAWLITILRREHVRAYKRYVPEIDPKIEPDDLPGNGQMAASETLALRRALAELSKEYREPLLLQILGRYSCDEIAEMLGLSPGAVMSRLFRARQKLRTILEEDKTTNVDRQLQL